MFIKCCTIGSMSSDIPINDSNLQEIIKKEARGLGDDTDFGKVQEILGERIITLKGNVSKDRFYFPKNLIERFDGNTVYYKITKDESKQYKRDY
jgi:hypothetical protein